MNIHEYHAQAPLAKYGSAVPEGRVALTAQQARAGRPPELHGVPPVRH